MRLDDLYRKVIMDHYQSPRNRGVIEDTAVSVDLNNPSCGDRLTLQLKMDGDTVADAKFIGEGCSISMASASMMTEAIKGLDLTRALQMADEFTHLMRGEPIEFDYEEIEALSGVSKFPARIKCATLAWNALRKGAVTLDEAKHDK